MTEKKYVKAGFVVFFVNSSDKLCCFLIRLGIIWATLEVFVSCDGTIVSPMVQQSNFQGRGQAMVDFHHHQYQWSCWEASHVEFQEVQLSQQS